MLYKLHSLGALVGIDAGRVIARLGTILFAQGRSVFDVILGRAVEFFFEDRLLVDRLELGLEVVECLSAAVRSTSCVGEFVP